jgi:energy-coupling factor transport system ATP-binding protein
VHAGEFVAIVGANGAGKTTLLQSIAGVVPVPRGQVTSRAPTSRAPTCARCRGGSGSSSRTPSTSSSHTVFDELAHGLRLQHLPETRSASATTMLRRFDLDDKADVHPFLLSGGQKRRLSVGTALVAGAPVLALDEPTFGQDRAPRRRAPGPPRGPATRRHDGARRHPRHAAGHRVRDRTIVVGDGRVLADAPTPTSSPTTPCSARRACASRRCAARSRA